MERGERGEDSVGETAEAPIGSAGLGSSHHGKGRVLRALGSWNMKEAEYSHHSFSIVGTSRVS